MGSVAIGVVVPGLNGDAVFLHLHQPVVLVITELVFRRVSAQDLCLSDDMTHFVALQRILIEATGIVIGGIAGQFSVGIVGAVGVQATYGGAFQQTVVRNVVDTQVPSSNQLTILIVAER